MKKDFLKIWCKLKERLNSQKRSTLYFKERELWWVRMGINIGVEAVGKGREFARPAIVVKKFNAESLHIIPLTGKDKIKAKNKVHFFAINALRDKVSLAMLSQARTVDSKRLISKIGILNKEEFKNLINAYVSYMFGKYL